MSFTIITRAWYWELHPENEEITLLQVVEGFRKARERRIPNSASWTVSPHSHSSLQ